MKKILRIVTGLLFAIFFLWLIFRQIDFEDIRTSLLQTEVKWIVFAVIAFLLGYSCRIQRWNLMLRCDNKKLKWVDCAGPFFGSFAFNNVLPFRAGDILRSFAFNKTLGVSSSVVIATLFVERLLDFLMVLLLLCIVLFFGNFNLNELLGVGSIALFTGVIVLVTVLLFPALWSPLIISLATILVRIFPAHGDKLLAEVRKSLDVLRHLSIGFTMLNLIVWSIAAWLAEGCVFLFSAYALPSVLQPLGAWLALPLGTLATLIPSTPGYVGTFDFFVVKAMDVFGNASESSIAYAVLAHMLIWLPPTLIGGLYMIFHPVKNSYKTKENRL